jgi:hypothetical protein
MVARAEVLAGVLFSEARLEVTFLFGSVFFFEAAFFFEGSVPPGFLAAVRPPLDAVNFFLDRAGLAPLRTAFWGRVGVTFLPARADFFGGVFFICETSSLVNGQNETRQAPPES